MICGYLVASLCASPAVRPVLLNSIEHSLLWSVAMIRTKTSSGPELGVVEDTAKDEREVILVKAADILVDATDGLLLDGNGDGLRGGSNATLGELLVVEV